MEESQVDDLPLSRTKKKQQAKEIEQLAEQLASMTDKAFKQLNMSEEIGHEAALARATKGRGSHKRQIKHLAGLLRKQEEELEQLQAQLLTLDQVTRSDRKEFHQLEKLRDRLCDKGSFDDAFNEILNLYPQIDRKALSRLARSVHQHADKRAFREIFKRLRDCHEEDLIV